ncbi:MAG: hypothetical protein IT385_10435 [Deltaproteobacteria bacterium]|nr:hypothetical protein [Deltaproteobacteria bacterium]
MTIARAVPWCLVLAVFCETAYATRVTGELRCADCQGAVLEVVDADLAPLFSLVFDEVGPFELDVPEAFGPIALFAYRDVDGDRVADLGTDRVAAADNPIDLSGGPVTGVVLDLGALPVVPTVEVSGAVACLDCTAITVTLAADAGPALASRALPAPGPFAFTVPEGFGAVTVSAFRDADGDARPDGDSPIVSQGPFTIATSDVSGVALTLPAVALPTVVISGAVACPTCASLPGGPPPVVVELVDGPTHDAGPVVARVRLDTPGPWSLEVPAGFGPVALRAFIDADRDLRPDPGAEPVAYASPLTVAASDVGGIDITLAVGGGEVVTLSGTITCSGDCAGLALVLLDGPIEAAARLVAFPTAPGPWAIDVPADLGPVHLYAFFDRDRDLAPDLGTSAVAAPRSPLTVGTSDEAGIDISLVGPVDDSVAIRGALTCGGCSAPLVLRMTADGLPLVLVPRAPGAFEVRAPRDFGAVTLSAFYDVDDDRRPDLGTTEVTASPDPIVVGSADVTGVTIALAPLVVTPTVQLSGTIDCDGCGASLVLALYQGPSAVDQAPLVVRDLAEGPFTLVVPQGFGVVALAGFIDEDRDRRADPGTEVGLCDQNPITVAASSQSGLTIHVPAPAEPERVTLSGSVVCSGCARVGLALAQGSGGQGLLVRLPLDLSASTAFATEVPAGLGEIHLFGFRDEDGDLAPDPGGGLVAARDNPIIVGADDIGGLLVDLDAAPVDEPQPEVVEGVETVDSEDAAEVVEGVETVEAVETDDVGDPAVEPSDDAGAETITAADESPVEDDGDLGAETTPDAPPIIREEDDGGCSCRGGATPDPVLALVLSLWILLLVRPSRKERVP